MASARSRRRAGPAVAPPVRFTDEDIYREIYDAIVGHRLTPGSKLSQDELGEIFGVSKTRVRPILFQLAQKKIVVIEPNRGAFVAQPSLAEAREVNAARQIIEEGIVRAVAQRIDRGGVRVLKEHLRQERAARLAHDRGEAHRLSGRFHVLLAEQASNAVLTEVLRDLISRGSLAVALYQAPAAADCSTDAHGEVVAALEARDADRAVASMLHHLREIEASLRLPGELDGRKGLLAAFGHLHRAPVAGLPGNGSG